MKLREIRWESAAKIGAGLLLAVAIVVSLPSLFASEKPAPLPPDVGLPQAAPPPAVLAPLPPTSPKPPKSRKHKPRMRPVRHQPRHRPRPDMTPSAPPIITTAIVPTAIVPTPAPGSHEDFGFERP